jgi:hypothetical protein
MMFLTSLNRVKFEILKEFAEGAVYWDVMLFSLVDAYRRFGKIFRIIHALKIEASQYVCM